MIAILPLVSGTPATRPPAGGTPATRSARAELAGAARQFEAIFVRQMLGAARKAGFGDPLLGSSALDTFREMQDSRLADVMAQSGTLGLARQIETHLARFVDAER